MIKKLYVNWSYYGNFFSWWISNYFNKIYDDRFFWDVLPVYILMAIAIFMMFYEAFFDKK